MGCGVEWNGGLRVCHGIERPAGPQCLPCEATVLVLNFQALSLAQPHASLPAQAALPPTCAIFTTSLGGPAGSEGSAGSAGSAGWPSSPSPSGAACAAGCCG